MGRQLGVLMGLLLVVVPLMSGSSMMADEEIRQVENLSFQADIYGGTTLETIEYLSDLSFHSFGGFGTNAHIYRANLVSGDQIAYAVSASDSYAFSLRATRLGGESVSLEITNAEYTAGVVTMPSPSDLRFTWEIEQSGLHMHLHRRVTLLANSQIAAGSVISEVFSVENLGPAFTLDTFSEHLHLDDRAHARDYDCDGIAETLVAVNSYTTAGYPIFGKLYNQQQNLHTHMTIDGNYATATHHVYLPLATGGEREFLTASYVTSTAKNSSEAEEQISHDVRTLLDTGELHRPWFVRSYNTDDRGAGFVNGRMVAGSRYSLYPDSGWVDVFTVVGATKSLTETALASLTKKFKGLLFFITFPVLSLIAT